jgi:hypothetical protein
MLVEPFDVAPPEPRSQWQNFAKEYSASDIYNSVKQRMFKDALTPPYRVNISQDMQEYVAFQEISFFGAHFFYAFSPTEKINNWQSFRKLNVPKKYAAALMIADPDESAIMGRITTKPEDRVRIAKEKQARPKVTIPTDGPTASKLSEAQEISEHC